jgi:hypothetical protein
VSRLIKEALAAHRAAQAGNTVIAINLALELVIVRKLLVCIIVSIHLTTYQTRHDLLFAISLNA